VQIQATQEEIVQLQEALGDMFSASEIADTQTQIAALQTKLNTLQTNYTSFLSNSQQEATNVLSFVESASEPKAPIGPNRNLTIVLSVTLAVTLAVAAAYALEYIDDSIRSEDDIEETVGLPLLTSLEKNGDYERYPAQTLKSPRSPISESFRDLRTRVLFFSLNKPLGTLLVTSANPFEGKSFTAANLAIVMAQAGYKTVLVDADLRRPIQHDAFRLNNDRGLSNLILEANALLQQPDALIQKSLGDLLDKVLQDTEQGGLKVLTSGTIPPNPSELIGSTGMIAIVEALKEKFDYLIFDSSPCIVVSDALLLASLADSVILVSSASQTRRKHLKKAVARLEEVDTNVVGVILNRVPRTDRGRYANYHPYAAVESISASEESDDADRLVDRIRNRFRRVSGNDLAELGEIEAERS
jgi:non-specific protein-tyrosine kinase